MRRCEHFRTDPSNQAELREYLHQLLIGRERLAATVPQLADWARREAVPSEEEIAALRALIRRNDELIADLDAADRAAGAGGDRDHPTPTRPVARGRS